MVHVLSAFIIFIVIKNINNTYIILVIYMQNANFIIYQNEIVINNITLIKEFSDKLFLINVSDTSYEIKGENLILKEVSNDNKTIKITGTIDSINKTNKVKEKNKSFLKRLIS